MKYTMPARKKSAPVKTIINRRARFDYELGDEIIAGLVLTGPEVRAARDGHIQLKGAYIGIQNNELWLTNASFSLKINQKGSDARTVDTTPRKLLASRKQINALAAERQAGMSIIPVKLLTNSKYIKLVIALGKGKKKYDKRQAIKKRDQAREQKKERML
jgi:SsrA-binding protein